MVLTRIGVDTLAAYTSMRIGTISCKNLPTTAGFERSNSVRSGAGFGGLADDGPASSPSGFCVVSGEGSSLAAMGAEVGVGIDVGAGGGISIAEASVECIACRAAALSALALALIKRPNDFSV